MTQVAVSPNVFVMGSQETLPIAFDVSALLLTGETPSSPSAQLIQIDTGTNYTAGMSGGPAFAANIVTQTVTGLTPRKRYRLVISFQAATGKTWSPYLNIECPE